MISDARFLDVLIACRNLASFPGHPNGLGTKLAGTALTIQHSMVKMDEEGVLLNSHSLVPRPPPSFSLLAVRKSREFFLATESGTRAWERG